MARWCSTRDSATPPRRSTGSTRSSPTPRSRRPPRSSATARCWWRTRPGKAKGQLTRKQGRRWFSALGSSRRPGVELFDPRCPAMPQVSQLHEVGEIELTLLRQLADVLPAVLVAGVGLGIEQSQRSEMSELRAQLSREPIAGRESVLELQDVALLRWRQQGRERQTEVFELLLLLGLLLLHPVQLDADAQGLELTDTLHNTAQEPRLHEQKAGQPGQCDRGQDGGVDPLLPADAATHDRCGGAPGDAANH